MINISKTEKNRIATSIVTQTAYELRPTPEMWMMGSRLDKDVS